MKIIKWTTIDVYFTKEEESRGLHLIERMRLKNLGYVLEHEDDGSKPYDYCDQYLKTNNVKEK
jgi:hypothetical protein